jgi:hypothetical protein
MNSVEAIGTFLEFPLFEGVQVNEFPNANARRAFTPSMALWTKDDDVNHQFCHQNENAAGGGFSKETSSQRKRRKHRNSASGTPDFLPNLQLILVPLTALNTIIFLWITHIDTHVLMAFIRNPKKEYRLNFSGRPLRSFDGCDRVANHHRFHCHINGIHRISRRLWVEEISQVLHYLFDFRFVPSAQE